MTATSGPAIVAPPIVSSPSVPESNLPAPSAPPVSRWRRSTGELLRRLDRLRRWEFWPAWALYGPLIPTLIPAALRAGRLMACTAVNPAIPLGGLVGESKSQILSLLPAEHVATFALIPAGPIDQRLEALDRFISAHAITWPIILKPDVGERGTGVRLIRDRPAAQEYLTRYRQPAVAQQYHPGPYEAGVFYIRHPASPKGRLFSITDKRFPIITGDGSSTIEQLIRRDPRLRLQLSVFLSRLGPRAATVPAAAEQVPLAISGNHCRGTTFLDGTHLGSPELLAAFDTITAAAPGIFFGRFDLRYRDRAEFQQGRGFKIIELNGLLSEPTHMYDPALGYWNAQRLLREQWSAAFAIGAENLRRGVPAPTLRELWRAVRAHSRRPDADAGSD